MKKMKLASDPIPSVQAERQREAEEKAVVQEFHAIVWTSNVMPLTATQVDRVREMVRAGFKKTLMEQTTWLPFLKKHADFILASPEARGILGVEGTKMEVDAAENIVRETKRSFADSKAAACPVRSGGVR